MENLLQTEEYQNIFLFNFMRNNEDWVCDHSRSDRLRYINPLNASYLGLQFHKRRSWLQAVEQKIELYFNQRQYDLEWSKERLPNSYCLLLLAIRGNEVLEIAHVHNENEFEAEKQLVISAVEFVTNKSN